jgi:hypothetical protein
LAGDLQLIAVNPHEAAEAAHPFHREPLAFW